MTEEEKLEQEAIDMIDLEREKDQMIIDLKEANEENIALNKELEDKVLHTEGKLADQLTKNFFSSIIVSGFRYAHIMIAVILLAAIYQWVSSGDEGASGMINFALGSSFGTIGTIMAMNMIGKRENKEEE